MRKKLNRYLYLFWGNHQWARKFIGGRWVRSIEPGMEWVQWNESILEEYLDWPLDSKEYLSENWPLSKEARAALEGGK